ncbi:MAG: hypothetical protein GC190_19125 [Alphaproteobacteria bacterium]|nr:hypothetical protein [Alphaproteobacteria bacterium]
MQNEMITLEVPTFSNVPMRISGTRIGLFLVHRMTDVARIAAREIAIWSVTHIATGMRLPYYLFTREAAERFAVEIGKLHSWDTIEVDIQIQGGRWIAGRPSSDVVAQIWALAAECGAISEAG